MDSFYNIVEVPAHGTFFATTFSTLSDTLQRLSMAFVIWLKNDFSSFYL